MEAFTGICPLKDQRIPRYKFQCLFTDWGSENPDTKRSPVPSRVHAVHLLLSKVRTPWVLLIHPDCDLIRNPGLSENADVVISEGNSTSRAVENCPLYYAVFVRTCKFPIMDNELDDSVAFLNLFNDIKKVGSIMETTPFWSYDQSKNSRP